MCRGKFSSTITSSSTALPALYRGPTVYDPFVAMSFVAAHTARVGVSVLIMPYRNPIATTKSLATIDRMSGGRLIAGVGSPGDPCDQEGKRNVRSGRVVSQHGVERRPPEKQ
jgi:alkanesulfonate monooxygenase SsuD/methylene tetrahydromethanopterin reductase-like flavin-dependent oxidoreductase (luciferase family)